MKGTLSNSLITMLPRPAFQGSSRKLVLAFDIGTTFSGISFSILDPGQIPEVKGVTRFPAQEHVSGSSKIPAILYYDQAGEVRAVGAEAMHEGIFEEAEDGGWMKVEWFKLHLRPNSQSTLDISKQLPPLPPDKTIVQVFADFLRYLFQCAESYIQQTHANGHDLWASVEHDIDYVLSHPNGWEGFQQAQMRKAAVLAGLIPDDATGHSRISFVTEGEASLHFSIENGLPPDVMKTGEGVIIVDGGGGTIDVSAYGRVPNSIEDAFEEIAPPQCHLQGSIFVSLQASEFLSNYLSDSAFRDDLDTIVQEFDKTTKLRFRNKTEPQFIKFGSTRDNEPESNIKYGQLKLSGSEVAAFFEPSVTCILKAVKEQHRLAHQPVKHVVLVGGFSSNDWLCSQIKAGLEIFGYKVVRPDNHLNKAVADGAISFYLDHCVQTRVSRYTYGHFCSTTYNPYDPEHVKREGNTYISLGGKKRVTDSFSIILPKNVQVSETKEFYRSYHISSDSAEEMCYISTTVWVYRGEIETPRWQDEDKDMYDRLCRIEVDLPHLKNQARDFEKHGPDGKYYELSYRIILLFGLTELKAQVSWKERGVEKRSPAKILYNGEDGRDA